MDKYKRYEKYNVVCGLEGHNQFCKKHKGAPCCFFCRDKSKCSDACKNDPTVCRRAFCEDKEKDR